MDLPNRKLPRLPDYDYSNQNYYHITLCTHKKAHLFGGINTLNENGKIAEAEMLKIVAHFAGVQIDKYVIMPNHVHAIVIIGCNDAAEQSTSFPNLSTIVGLYKAGVSKRIHETNPNAKIWQKSFYDHVIRDEKGYLGVWQYIDENPLKWEDDEHYSPR